MISVVTPPAAMVRFGTAVPAPLSATGFTFARGPLPDDRT